MNVLSIGNSFSQDAQRYLHQIAKADGVSLQAFNLYIGGCSLSMHYRNMLSEERAYTLEMNGESTGFNVSLKEALLNRDWDIVTVQQVSHQSPQYDSYQPFLKELVSYVRRLAPKTKIILHETWAYEQGSEKLQSLGYTNYRDMLCDIKESYRKAAADIDAECIIPSGEVFDALLSGGVEKIHRDTFHASLGLGRYALGLVWYKCLTGNDIADNSFCDFDEEILSQDVLLAKKCVSEIADKCGF